MSPSPWHPFRNHRLAGVRSSRRRRLTFTLLATVLATGTATGTPATAGETAADQATASHATAVVAQATPESCEALADLELPETTQISAQLVTSGSAAGQSDLPEFCRVALTVAPQINIEVWLPTDSYNGRFQAVGGGGYVGVISFGAMARAMRDGYATASTDTGHSAFEMPGGSFGLNADGTLNRQLIEDFASRSLFELTKKSQDLIDAFYGQGAAYSYWNGCSTGGRQGLMLAQRFPEGYDGILAGAPAINWDRFIPAELWPQVVMQQELGGPIEPSKLALATEAAVAHSDTLDGVADGIIADPVVATSTPRPSSVRTRPAASSPRPTPGSSTRSGRVLAPPTGRSSGTGWPPARRWVPWPGPPSPSRSRSSTTASGSSRTPRGIGAPSTSPGSTRTSGNPSSCSTT